MKVNKNKKETKWEYKNKQKNETKKTEKSMVKSNVGTLLYIFNMKNRLI